jgi:hypothetical protein
VNAPPLPPPTPAAGGAPTAAAEDPHGLGLAVTKLSPESLQAGYTSLAVLAVTLRLGERVEAVVQGRIEGVAAVAALTDQRVVLVNEREWSPQTTSFDVVRDLVVQGLQDDRTASLTFIGGGENVTISTITDRPLAHDMARLVRGRVSELGG